MILIQKIAKSGINHLIHRSFFILDNLNCLKKKLTLTTMGVLEFNPSKLPLNIRRQLLIWLLTLGFKKSESIFYMDYEKL